MSAEHETNRYIEAVGRRKTATARVRMVPGARATVVTVNDRPFEEYFQSGELREIVLEPLQKSGIAEGFSVSALASGGGIAGQAEAVRHGISRCLVEWEAELKPVLKQYGFLKRDPRMRERKKFGLKRARRARQWRKR